MLVDNLIYLCYYISIKEEDLFMKELWKDIEGYEGTYQVSNLGMVKSLDRLTTDNRRLKGKLLAKTNSKGYIKVTLTNKNKSDNRDIHRLVAQAFIPNPENKPQVNHIDEDKTNNIVYNLEWVTAKENMNHGTCRKRSSLKQSIKIVCVTTGKVYNSIADASRDLNLNSGTISKIINGKMKQTKGFTFKYKE